MWGWLWTTILRLRIDTKTYEIQHKLFSLLYAEDEKTLNILLGTQFHEVTQATERQQYGMALEAVRVVRMTVESNISTRAHNPETKFVSSILKQIQTLLCELAELLTKTKTG